MKVDDLNEMPNGWAYTTLENVATWASGGTPSRSIGAYFQGTIPWIKTGELGDKYIFDAEEKISEQAISASSAKVFPKGSVGIAMYGATIGKVSIWGIDASTNQACAVGLPVPDVLDKEFLYYFLLSQKRSFIKAGKGGAQPNISQGIIKEWPINLPTLSEQHRIVAKIEELFSELDKGIENLKTAREQLKVYRQALLKHAFEGKLTAAWREQNRDQLETAAALLARIQTEREKRYQQQLQQWQTTGGSKPKAPKPLPPLTAEELAELPELPEGWAWGKWEDVLDHKKGAFKRGPFGSSLKKEFFVKSGYKVYEQYCPINDDCSFERYYISEEKFKELEGFSVCADDFLISCSGVTLGRITQVPKSYKEGIINQALLRVRLNSTIYDHKFFKEFFRSRYFQKRIFENSTGTAIPNVKGVNELKAIPVPLCSLKEQQQIILELETRLSVLNELDQTLTASLQQAEALRQSILKKAFSGQLVAQDDRDEPAAALLARIKAERATAVKSPAVRRSGGKV